MNRNNLFSEDINAYIDILSVKMCDDSPYYKKNEGVFVGKNACHLSNCQVAVTVIENVCIV